MDPDRDNERWVWMRGGQAARDLPQDREDCRLDQQPDLFSYSLEPLYFEEKHRMDQFPYLVERMIFNMEDRWMNTEQSDHRA